MLSPEASTTRYWSSDLYGVVQLNRGGFRPYPYYGVVYRPVSGCSFCSTASSLSTRSEQSQGGCCEPLTAPLVLVGVCGVLVDPHDLFNMRLLGLTELMAILMTPHFPRRGGLCTGLCGGLTIESALVGYVVCAQCEEFVAMLVAGVGLSPFNPVAMRVFLPVRLGSLWALRAPASGRLCPQRCR